jgi:hypothetical protein
MILITLLLSGCYVIKRGDNGSFNINESILSVSFLEKIQENNISKKGFFIEKAEVIYRNENGTEGFLASIKHEPPDKFLISIRSKSGLEVTRVFLSHDTLLANDRINRIFYYGKPIDLKKKYGITASALPLLFGDIMNVSKTENFKGSCSKDDLTATVSIDGIKVIYLIDCDRKKAIQAIMGNSANDQIEMKFSDFKLSREVSYPEKILIINSEKNESIEIMIIRIRIPWNEKIEFIPGNKFEKIQL